MKRLLLALGLATLIVQHGTERISAVPQPTDDLKFFKSHFVTGDYVVGGVGMYGSGTGDISISGVPPDADIAAAYLYWQVVVPNNGSPDTGGMGVTFKGYPLSTAEGPFGKPLGGGTPTCSSAGGGAGSSNGSKRTYTYRADVVRFLDVAPVPDPLVGLPPPGAGKLIANGLHSLTLPTNDGLSPLGASLVIIYRDPSLPLSAFVIYDGTYAMDQDTEGMQQAIEGFYDADGADGGSRITHIVGSGQLNKSEILRFDGAVGAANSLANPFPVTNPFTSAAGNLWDNPTYTITADPTRTSVTTSVDHQGFSSFDCLTWAAIVYKTTVKDTDGDGLLNRWEDSTTPVLDPYGRPLPNLKAMGASNDVKDLFIEIGYLQTDGFIDDDDLTNDPTMSYGGVNKPGHSHRPGHQALKLMGDALWDAPPGAQPIRVHYDVGQGYDGGSIPDCVAGIADPGACIIRGAGLARGGEVINESFTQCPAGLPAPGAPPWECQFNDYPGTVGWKTGYQYMRDQILVRPASSPTPPAPPALDPCDDPSNALYAQCTRRFDPNRINMYHYALFAHSVGLPQAEHPCLDGTDEVPGDSNGACASPLTSNPKFRIPRTNTGLGDFPGGDILMTMGGFNDLNGLPVGTPFMQASTLMHEFGHNAGRRHGGEAFEPNCRPTYLSVMNYMYQLRGLLDDDGEPNLGFSQEVGAALSENNLNPLSGFKRYRLGWFAPLAGSYLAGQPGARTARSHCNGSPITDGAQMVRIDARLAGDDIDWDADGNPATAVTTQDVNFSGSSLESYPALSASTDWAQLDLQQIGSRRSPGGSYIDLDGSLALGPLSILSGKGDAGKGDAGKGDAGKGDAGKGDAGKGDAGKGDAGGLSGKGDAGKGDAGGGDLFGSTDPDLPGGELDAKLAADMGVGAPNAFNAVVITTPGANYHDVRLTWNAPNEGNVQSFTVYRVAGTDIGAGASWTQVGAVVPFVPGQVAYSTIDSTDLVNDAFYTYFAVATYPDLDPDCVAPCVITSEPSRRATIQAINNPPTISDIADRTIDVNTNTGLIPFTIGDADNDVAAATLSKASSNLTLVPLANIVFGGSGANRTVQVTPASNQVGTSTITVTVTSGGASASDSFVLTVVIPPATFFNVQNAPPVPPKSFKAGSSVPMKWQFKRGSTVVNSALVQHTVTVSGPIPGGTLVITNTDPGGSSFQYSATTNTWQFNLQTKLPSGANYPVGQYQLTITPTTAGFLGTSFGLTLVK